MYIAKSTRTVLQAVLGGLMLLVGSDVAAVARQSSQPTDEPVYSGNLDTAVQLQRCLIRSAPSGNDGPQIAQILEKCPIEKYDYYAWYELQTFFLTIAGQLYPGSFVLEDIEESVKNSTRSGIISCPDADVVPLVEAETCRLEMLALDVLRLRYKINRSRSLRTMQITEDGW